MKQPLFLRAIIGAMRLIGKLPGCEFTATRRCRIDDGCPDGQREYMEEMQG